MLTHRGRTDKPSDAYPDGRRWPRSTSPHEKLLTRVTRRTMELLDLLDVDSNAFPAVGGGKAGIPYDDVATHMARLIADSLEHRETPVEVTIYLLTRPGGNCCSSAA